MSKLKTALSAGSEFELGMSADALADIIENKTSYIDIEPTAAYESLSAANKRALVHLVKAAVILDDVFLKQDHADNIRAKEILQFEAAIGNPVAENALKFFIMRNGFEGPDMYAREPVILRLFKNKQIGLGGALYPDDLDQDGLVNYIVAHPEQAAAIFSNNTAVGRENGRLVAKPYSVAFREEMEGAARELLLAAREVDHAGFAAYLRWQAQALVNDSDPEAMFQADKAWINLEDSPLEFTIERESYKDNLSAQASVDPEVKSVLEENGIKVKSKDFIGTRVGIVNSDSYERIALYRKHLDGFNQQMPLLNQYLSAGEDLGKGQMSLADVDLVALTGDYAAVRGGVTLAQNLPNSDKLSVQLKTGRRLVFHRQIRQNIDVQQRQKFLDALIDPAQHKLYDEDASFLFTVGHELAHSLGPRATDDGRDKKASLGKYGSILEENKADVASIFMTGYMVTAGAMTLETADKIYLTWASGFLPNRKPAEHEAHRLRSIMQFNYFRENGAINFEKGGKLSIIPEKMVPVAQEMLTEVVQIQLEGNSDKAEAFVNRYSAWNEDLQYALDKNMELQPKLYQMLRQPLKERILATLPS